MKKISIMGLMIITALSMYGCAKAEAEKHPVIIETDETNIQDTLEEKDDNLSTEDGENLPFVDEDDESDEANPTTTEHNPTNDETFDVEIELEGMPETFTGRTYHSSFGYQMVYDIDRFQVSHENGSDSFFAENPNPEIYPYVYINISKREDVSIDEYVSNLEESLSTDYEVVRHDQKTVGNYTAEHFYARTGLDWNSAVRNYYLIEAADSSVYVIEIQYFVEAEEGYGARISALLDTFTMID